MGISGSDPVPEYHLFRGIREWQLLAEPAVQ